MVTNATPFSQTSSPFNSDSHSDENTTVPEQVNENVEYINPTVCRKGSDVPFPYSRTSEKTIVYKVSHQV